MKCDPNDEDRLVRFAMKEKKNVIEEHEWPTKWEILYTSLSYCREWPSCGCTSPFIVNSMTVSIINVKNYRFVRHPTNENSHI